jgi:DNA/RNA-binding domain of Phe-tRNA-synthetase-like protein
VKYNITAIIEKYPEIHIGLLVGKNMENTRQIPDLYLMQKQAIKLAQEQIGDQPPTKHPYIASWRELYRSFGTKPGDYRPSAEALIRRSIKTGKLPRINNAVDLYNIVSVTHIIPIGGFDTDKIDGDIYLRFSEGGEKFTPLGPGKLEHTYHGEAVYSDNSRILTRRWNFRDAEQTKITTETQHLVMFIDAAPQIPLEEVEKTINQLHILYEKNCGGEYTLDIACKENPETEI